MRRCVPVAIAMLLSRDAFADAPPPEPFEAETIFAQVGGGFVGMIGGSLVGVAIGRGLDQVTDGPRDWFCKYDCLATIAGFFAGYAAGVQVAGDLDHGRGRWWGTALGSVTSVSIVVGGIYIHDKYDLDAGGGTGLATAALLLAGPIVGYHLTADEPDPDATVMFGIAAGRF